MEYVSVGSIGPYEVLPLDSAFWRLVFSVASEAWNAGLVERDLGAGNTGPRNGQVPAAATEIKEHTMMDRRCIARACYYPLNFVTAGVFYMHVGCILIFLLYVQLCIHTLFKLEGQVLYEPC
jgi:hypothetical protein